MVTTEGHNGYVGDDNTFLVQPSGTFDKPEAGKTKTKLTGDQITNIVGSVAAGLGSIFEFGKSLSDIKKAKQETRTAIVNNAASQGSNTANTGNSNPSPGMSTGMKVGIAVGVIVVIGGIVGFVIYKSKKGAAKAA